MNKRLFATLVGILLSVNFALASDSKPQCPDIPLLQNASAEEIRLSMVTEHDTAFLTDQYCLVLYGPKLNELQGHYFAFYNNLQKRNLFRNYSSAYSRIVDVDARYLFVHFLLRELSQKMSVTAHNELFEKVHIIFPFHSRKAGKLYWYSMYLSQETSYQDFMRGLSKVQQGNPQPEDYPAMMALIAKVMDGNHFLTDDEINTLIQHL